MSNIKQAMKGDKQAFVKVIEEHKLALYKVMKAILQNEDDVCDAMQETLINIYKNISKLQSERYFKTWATRIAINECYHIIKKQKVNQDKIVKIQNNTSNEDMTLNKEIEKTDIEVAISKLDKELKIVVVMYYYNNLKVHDIAEVLEIPAGTVKSRLNRARESLYQNLKPEEVNVNEE